MLIDSRTLEKDAEISCDVCIIGGGAAGITLARQLAAGPLETVLLESGGLESDAESQRLTRGECAGFGHDGYLETSRLRFFGGSTNHWWGMCAPLDPIDFEKRPWVPYSGWPIDRVELDPWYEKAQPVCALGPYDYDVANWEPTDPLALGGRTQRRMWQLSPRLLFGQVYREELRASPNLRVHLNATAVALESERDGGSVRRVEVRTLEGLAFRVRARGFVLAAGGIENPRLLLASDAEVPGGLGNQHGAVGRFFMEHPHSPQAGEILFADPIVAGWRKIQDKRGAGYRLNLGITEDTQRREGLLNTSFAIYQSGELDDEIEPSLLALLHDITGATPASADEPGRAKLFARCEQAPAPESRVELIGTRDALGMRQVRLDWRLGALDTESIRRSLEILAEDTAARGTARVRIASWLSDGAVPQFGEDLIGGSHHMGTTRMSDDPKSGVVDRDARVHGIENLWIAGSSVFSTGGWANPTLTIVALTLRLGDHLQRELAA